MLDRSVRTGLAVVALIGAILIALRNIVLERPLEDWWIVLILLLLAGFFGWWMGRAPAQAEEEEEEPAPRIRQFLPGEAETAPPALAEPAVEPVVVAATVAEPVAEVSAAPVEAVTESPAAVEAPVKTVAETPAAPPPIPAEEPKAAEPAPAAKPKRAKASGKDDLKRVEGIGPKMEKALRTAGIETFARLAEATEDELRAAIEAQGMRFAPSMPTWAKQAAFLAAGDETGFEAYKDHLVAGREPD
ncbi:MAG: hypothetical protein IT320_10665 [Anaerolineae bacterium]|nr:hypothetical protein [Anaerolineae bacterium]